MPDNYISQIDFGDGIVRKIKSEGGTGLRIGDVNNFAATSASGIQKIVLTWEDPDDLEIGGVVQASWGGTVIVRKVGSVPISTADGIIILDNKVRDQYSVNGYEDTTVDFDTVYYYRAFPYTTDDLFTEGSYVSEEIENVRVYGVEWDGTATTAWTRTDSAANFEDPNPYFSGMSGTPSSPFDNIMPWSGMVIEERTGGTMVKIPKFWYKLAQNGAGMKIQIADSAEEGFSVSPAHKDRGDGKGERDVVYVGRYHCGSSAYRSVTGQTPKNNITRSTARSAIAALDSDLWLIDFATRFTIWLLYIVEFADWNSQAKIGYGCGNNSGVEAMGYTDSMPYHTGTTQSNRTAYGFGTQYRNIEGLWDNVYDWCDGCYYNSNGLNIILNPNNFSDSSGGTAVGVPTSGWPSAFTVEDVSGTFPTFIPTTSSGSDSTYSCDNWGFSAVAPCLYVGGGYGQGLSRGLFYVNCNSASIARADRGCRLMELPASA